MRLKLPFGYQLTRATGHAARQPGETPSPGAVAAATSKRSYASPLGIDFDKSIKANVDFALYDTIVRAVPFVDRALRQLARMTVPFEVQCDNETTQDALNHWLESECRVEDLFRGFLPFSRPYVRQSLQYGKSAGEIVLSPTKRDIEGLCVIPAGKIRICQTDDGLQLGEDDGLGQAIPYEHQETFVYSALNKEQDNPHGVSLLRSIPFVTDCALRMELALRQMWQRHGAPSFFIQYKIADEVALSDEAVQERRDEIENAWYDSQEARFLGEGIMDFVAAVQGEIIFTAIGADVKELSFQDPFRTMMEQVVSSVELAPFMLGLQWSTTERLSQQQADAIIGAIADFRAELKPDFLHILNWVQRVRGLPGEIDIAWAEVTLQDRVETAKADLTEAQAKAMRLTTELQAWANGFIGQEEAARLVGYEIEGVAQELDAPVMGGVGGAGAAADAMWARFP